MHKDYFFVDTSRHVWEIKYRYREGKKICDQTIEDTWHRVASTLANVEPRDQGRWSERFFEALQGFKFLPGGRILAGAGTRHQVTLFNCFVMGVIEDSMDGIFDNLKEGALTMQQGGGVGYDFSTLRPYGTPARTAGTIASGPVSFMRIWDSMCSTVLSTGARRGAMMGTLRCDHPDIERFIEIKQDPRELRRFNVSVQVSDEFMQAVREDKAWPLVFPAEELGDIPGAEQEVIMRRWTGSLEPVLCRLLRRVSARSLWDKIMQATYDYAEPGVMFVDQINRFNNLWYREYITATNPCAEIPLPPYGACDLGSINLACFVREPFSERAHLDREGIREMAALGTRMLDNVIDVSRFPLDRQAQQARGTRRIGLGITGLADTLIMLGLHYGQAQARELAAQIMEIICHTAYRTSIALAQEKGSFPFFQKDQYLEGEFIRRLPEEIQAGIREKGIRNSHLTAIAPTGTISLLANNISSGIEPVFDFEHTRRVLELDGSYSLHKLKDAAYRRWLELKGEQAPLPDYFVDARSLQPLDHLDMEAALQTWVDNAISKTINIPRDYPFQDFRSLYEQAYDKGLKGCTTFRPNPVTEAVLTGAKEDQEEGEQSAHCCSMEREAD